MFNPTDNRNQHKGGRPKKPVKRDEQLAVMCTLIERTVIQQKARLANASISEYLRTLAMKGQVDRVQKVLPKEILQLSGTLNHVAANLNQIAKKRNSNEDLDAFERAELQQLSSQVKQLVKDIKNYLK